MRVVPTLRPAPLAPLSTCNAHRAVKRAGGQLCSSAEAAAAPATAAAARPHFTNLLQEKYGTQGSRCVHCKTVMKAACAPYSRSRPLVACLVYCNATLLPHPRPATGKAPAKAKPAAAGGEGKKGKGKVRELDCGSWRCRALKMQQARHQPGPATDEWRRRDAIPCLPAALPLPQGGRKKGGAGKGESYKLYIFKVRLRRLLRSERLSPSSACSTWARAVVLPSLLPTTVSPSGGCGVPSMLSPTTRVVFPLPPFFVQVLKQVHPDTGISSKSMAILNSFITDQARRGGWWWALKLP